MNLRTHIMIIAALCIASAPNAQAMNNGSSNWEKVKKAGKGVIKAGKKIVNKRDSFHPSTVATVAAAAGGAVSNAATGVATKTQEAVQAFKESEATLMFAPAADALMKLYCWKYAEKYSEVLTPEVRAEADNILRSLGKNPQTFDVKFITTRTFNGIYSFSTFDKKTNRTTIYVEKFGLQNSLAYTTAFKLLFKERIQTALVRPFVTYELIKAVMPFMVGLVLNQFNYTKASICNTFTGNVTLATGINYLLNIVKLEKYYYKTK